MINQTLIIAEVGVNHNGDIVMAKKLIDAAALAGADIVKFQTFKADCLATFSAEKANYQKLSTDIEESQYSMLQNLELTESMHHELISHCKFRNIDFLSTGFDIESVTFLASLGQKCFKIPSGEITNLPYLIHIGSIAKKVILSTGMSTMTEIKRAIEVLEKAGTMLNNITILHCTTEYPTPMDEVNLKAMQTIKKTFDVTVGYSDHTLGIEVPTAAVAMGASIIEKHFTLDRSLPGPDHKASLEPIELKAMVRAIRNIEVALGDGVKNLTSSEKKNVTIARKSLVAKRPIKVGEIFTAENITSKRPGTGLSPMLWNDVIGKKSIANFSIDELIFIKK